MARPTGTAGQLFSRQSMSYRPQTTSERIILVVFVLLGLFLVHKAYVQGQDFRVFYTAGQRLMAGEEIYRFTDGANPFKYWPGFAYLIAPFALLPLPVAQVVWAILNVSALVATLMLVIGPLFPVRRYHIALGATVLALSPITDHFMDGQSNLLLLAMILAGFTLIGRGGRQADGGTALIVLAGAIKLYPLLFLVMLPLKRAWRQVIVVAVALGVVVAVPVLFGGLENATHQYRMWWTVLADSGNHLDLSSARNQSLLGMYLRFVPAEALAKTLYQATAAVVLLVIALAMPRTPLRGIDKRFVLDFTMVATAMLLVSPLTWMHYYVFLLPFMILIVGELAVPATRNRLAWIGLGLILISAFPTMALVGRSLSAAVLAISNHVIESLLVLGYCIYRRRLGPDIDPTESSSSEY